MANSVKDLQLRELKDSIKELNKLIETLREALAAVNAREADLKQERDNLKEQVEYLQNKLYGPSSEKRSFDIPGQLNIFNEAEVEQDIVLNEEADPAPAQKKPRKKKTISAEKLKGLPVEEKELDLPEEEKTCPECGTELQRIGREFVKREVKFIPARLKVIEYYSINYKCPSCEEEELPCFYKGKAGFLNRLHGMASAGTVAWVMYQKFCNCVPLYRQEADWKLYGLDIGRSTLSNWVINNTQEFFDPMYDFLKRELLKRSFLMADETPVQVLREPGRRAQTKSYMWIYRTGEDDGPPIILYKYSPTRAGDNPVEFLDGFSGYLMCDGYSGYNKVRNAKRCACWAHVRRALIDAVPKGHQYDYSHPAVQGVMYVSKLFDLEAEIHQKYKDPEQIREARLQKEKPVLEGFWAWLDRQNPTRNSRLYKAVTYIQNRRPYLDVYLEDGRCSFSNNASERSVKPFVMGRKNWLFSNTPAGAVASEKIYTIIEVARANGVNVYHYLCYLMEKGPSYQMTDEELSELAPWNDSCKQEIERRMKDPEYAGLSVQ